MKAIRTIPLAIVILATMFIGIGISKLTGYWKLTSSKEPAKFKTGENAGVANPADIRGSYTWQDIENAFGIPAQEIAAAFSAPGNAFASTGKVNALEAAVKEGLPEGKEIGTDSVRLFVALYKRLPYNPEESTVLPNAAVKALAAAGIQEKDIEKYALPNTLVASPATTAQSAESGTAQAAISTTEHAAPANTVTGKTTFGELYAWGLSQAQVEEALGFKPGPVSQSVRDGATAAGASFTDLKAKLQVLLDAIKK